MNWLRANRLIVAVHAGAAIIGLTIAYSTVYAYAMTATIIRHFLEMPVPKPAPVHTGVVDVSILPAGTKPGQAVMMAPTPAHAPAKDKPKAH